MTMNTFRIAFPNGTPRKLRTNSISDELYEAGENLWDALAYLKWNLKFLEEDLNIQ